MGMDMALAPCTCGCGQEEDIGDAIAAKICNVLLASYRPYVIHPNIRIRLHSTTLYNSIYWLDDDMLVNTHAYGVRSARSTTETGGHWPVKSSGHRYASVRPCKDWSGRFMIHPRSVRLLPLVLAFVVCSVNG
jgi:hypothetical protein